jgi:hypothetical protein
MKRRSRGFAIRLCRQFVSNFLACRGGASKTRELSFNECATISKLIKLLMRTSRRYYCYRVDVNNFMKSNMSDTQ